MSRFANEIQALSGWLADRLVKQLISRIPGNDAVSRAARQAVERRREPVVKKAEPSLTRLVSGSKSVEPKIEFPLRIDDTTTETIKAHIGEGFVKVAASGIDGWQTIYEAATVMTAASPS
jgi:hypothetical protein